MSGWIKISCKSSAGLNISPTFISFDPILSFTKQFGKLRSSMKSVAGRFPLTKECACFFTHRRKNEKSSHPSYHVEWFNQTTLDGIFKHVLSIYAIYIYICYIYSASIDAMKQIWRQTVSIYSFPETHITGMNRRNNQEVGNQPALSGEASMWPISWSLTSFFSDWLKKHATWRFIVKCFLFLEPFLWTFRMVVCLCVCVKMAAISVKHSDSCHFLEFPSGLIKY